MGIISPKYSVNLAKTVNDALWNELKTYAETKAYIMKWHDSDSSGYNNWENFQIFYKDSEYKQVDTLTTFLNLDGEILLKIAIDLGVETPDFIPSIPTFRNEIKSSYETASTTFETAFKQIESHPDIAVGLVNSALECIIKEILKDDRISTKAKDKDTLYDLTSEILKVLQMFPNSEIPAEIKQIGSSLLGACQGIEKIRSEKTILHGKTKGDYVIDDSLYTYFIVNCVTTVGLFLISFYKTKYPKLVQTSYPIGDDLPF